MGKNTPKRQEFIIENLRVENDLLDDYKLKNIVRRTFSIVKVLYFIFNYAFYLPLLIVLTTQGSIKEMLLGSWHLFLLLFIVPVITSIIGFVSLLF